VNEPIESICHIGIIHPMIYPEVMKGEGPIIETLTRIAADDFFSAVEVTQIKDPAVRAEAAKLLAVAGMDVVVAGQPPLLMNKLSLNDPDQAGRQRAIEMCQQSVDQGYELGASIVAVLSGPDPGDADRAKQTDLLVDSLVAICRYAEEKAEDRMVAISLETFDDAVDKRCLIGPTKAAAEVAARVKEQCSNFGLTLDLSHQPLLGESIADMIVEATDHLIHAHIGNCIKDDQGHEAYGDQHPRFGIPGGCNGVEEVHTWMESLYYNGYFRRSTPTSKPVVSFEVKPLAGEDPELVIANAKRTLKEAWAPREVWERQ
jgi:sugar phosphate isomerase/epimerase